MYIGGKWHGLLYISPLISTSAPNMKRNRGHPFNVFTLSGYPFIQGYVDMDISCSNYKNRCRNHKFENQLIVRPSSVSVCHRAFFSCSVAASRQISIVGNSRLTQWYVVRSLYIQEIGDCIARKSIQFYLQYKTYRRMSRLSHNNEKKTKVEKM